MHRCCRAGRIAWQQLRSGPRPLSGASTTRRATITRSRGFASTAPGNGGNGGKVKDTNKTEQANGASDSRRLPSPSRSKNDNSRVIFSGIQPTGVPHLGNYLGALREWKRLQDTEDPSTRLIFCIVDLHALTIPRPAEELLRAKDQMLAALLAVGINLERSVVYFQSAIGLHTELQWLLSCTASVGYLSRMTQWKSKMQLGGDAKSADPLTDPKARKALKLGLFSYPVLQAADVLLHRATHVPVGEDQRQHLEFARECATNFNHTHNTDYMVAPETIVSPARRVMSLTNPLQKMSKSDPSPRSRIDISDTPDEIAKKIRGAVTDSQDGVTYDPAARPGVANLVEMLSALDPHGRTPAQLGEELRGRRIAELKGLLVQVLCDELGEVRERYQALMAEPDKLRAKVDDSTRWARIHASHNMDVIRQIVGLTPP